MSKLLKVGDDVFEAVPDEARLATEFLIRTHERLGEPNDLNATGIAFLKVLYNVWMKLFPEEYYARLHDQKNEFTVERTVQQANKADGGYFVASFPPRFFYLFRTFFPDIKITDRSYSNIITREIPLFKGTQYRT